MKSVGTQGRSSASRTTVRIGHGALCVVMALCVWLFIPFKSADAQSESSNFRLGTVQVSGGGGISTGAGLQVSGGVIPSSGSLSWAGNRAVYNGIESANMGIGGQFLIYYATDPVDTLDVEDHMVEIAYGGGAGPATGTFYYRYGGHEEYSSAPLLKADGDTLYYVIADSLFGVRGLEYFVKLDRGAYSRSISDSISPGVFVNRVTNIEGQRPISVPGSRYRIVGVPLHVEGANTVSAVFEDDLGTPDATRWRLGSWDNLDNIVLEFPDAAPVVPGQGYWYVSRNNSTYGTAGYSVRPNRYVAGKPYYEVPLLRGWNQVANPFPFNVDWDDVMVDHSGTVTDRIEDYIEDAAYWYSGSGYFWAQTLPAWDGFFIFSKVIGVSMLFPFKEQRRQVNRPAIASIAAGEAQVEWQVHLRVEADGQFDEGNYAGVHRNANDGLDIYDSPEPPRAPGAPRLAFVLPDDDPYYRRSDFRPPIDEGSDWYIDISPARNRRITVTGIEQLPDRLEAVLILDMGLTTILSEGAIIEVPDDAETARLVIGDRNYTATEVAAILPNDFQLFQNYPNPFNPVTNLRFSLPEATGVLLEVYNLLGQRVIKLVDQQMPAGVHTVTWNSLDYNGKPVATGVYFYRLTTDRYTEVKKMLLLK